MASRVTLRNCFGTSNLYSSINANNYLPGSCSIISRLFSTRLTRGDIVLYQGKFEGETGDVLQSKDRPHVIISSDRVLEVTKRVVLAPLSSATSRHDYEVIIPSNDQTKLSKPSKIVANQIRTGDLKNEFIKVGSAATYLPKINQALMTCFGDFKILSKVNIARGDVVEIDFGNSARAGVVVSNDIGNHYSRIAMLAHAYHRSEVMNEFDLLVNSEGNVSHKKLLVQCYMINTFDQEFMDKAGRISKEDLDRVTQMLFKTLGIVE